MSNKDLTNKKISESYQKLVQIESGSMFDGLGKDISMLILNSLDINTGSLQVNNKIKIDQFGNLQIDGGVY